MPRQGPRSLRLRHAPRRLARSLRARPQEQIVHDHRRKKVGESRVEKTAGNKYSLYEGQYIGQDSGSPLDFTYTPPYNFTGKLDRVTVELKR